MDDFHASDELRRRVLERLLGNPGTVEKLIERLQSDDVVDEAGRRVGIPVEPEMVFVNVWASSPADIRAAGWMVAVHNDYTQDGVWNTFWLFTKGDRCVKGEGRSDGEALNEVRRQLGMTLGEG